MRFPRTVYAIEHQQTGKIYIGSSCNFKERIKSHLRLLKNGKHPIENLQNDFNSNSELKFYELDQIHAFEERAKEHKWMDHYKTRDKEFGYNYKDRGYLNEIKIEQGKPAEIDSK